MKIVRIIFAASFFAIGGCASVSELASNIPSSFWQNAADAVINIFTTGGEE